MLRLYQKQGIVCCNNKEELICLNTGLRPFVTPIHITRIHLTRIHIMGSGLKRPTRTNGPSRHASAMETHQVTPGLAFRV